MAIQTKQVKKAVVPFDALSCLVCTKVPHTKWFSEMRIGVDRIRTGAFFGEWWGPKSLVFLHPSLLIPHLYRKDNEVQGLGNGVKQLEDNCRGLVFPG